MVLFRVFQDFKLAYQNTPLVRPRLQVSPLKLAGRARIELVVQWPRIVIADDLFTALSKRSPRRPKMVVWRWGGGIWRTSITRDWVGSMRTFLQGFDRE